MRTTESFCRFTIATAMLLVAGGLQAADKKMPTDAELIASAMSAAPTGIAKHATIVVPGADGTMRTLRKGTNDFTCMPDNPATPGPDPMCADKNAWAWLGAYMAHKPPPPGVGLAYMLEGGVDASNTDPFATKPATGQHWIRTGPHLMIFGADAAFYDLYPKDTTPDTAVPYVMWPGTPYQHLMTPVH
ncbi:hypothetical protein [Rhodanobacter hydrolyticus]